MRRTAAVFVALVLGCGLMVSNVVRSEAPDARLKGAVRRAPVNGWTYVRLEGTPAEIGFQNGYLLAPEIQDLEKVFSIELPHDTEQGLGVLPRRGRDVLWPHIEQRVPRRAAGHRRRPQGERRHARSLGRRRDERGARVELLHRGVRQAAPATSAPQSTPPRPLQRVRRHRQLHEGRQDRHRAQQLDQLSRRRALDDRRSTCARPMAIGFLMDGLPGLIHSADDFGLNDAGIVITETTITGFCGLRRQRRPRVRAGAQGDAVLARRSTMWPRSSRTATTAATRTTG